MSLLKVDYDLLNYQPIFEQQKRLLEEIAGLTVVDHQSVLSRSGKGWHVKVWIKEELKPEEALACQLILGSDVVRECFNFRRIRRLQKNWNIFFEGKEVMPL